MAVKSHATSRISDGVALGHGVMTVVDERTKEAVFGIARMMDVGRVLRLCVPLTWAADFAGVRWPRTLSICGMVTPARMLMISFPRRASVTAGSPMQEVKSCGWQARRMVSAACTARAFSPWRIMTGGGGRKLAKSLRRRSAESEDRTQAMKRVGFGKSLPFACVSSTEEALLCS